MWTEALPIVVYSTCTEVLVRAPDWPRLYGSLQALKGHAQEYPGCQRFDVYFRAEPEERGAASTATRPGTRSGSSRRSLSAATRSSG